MGNLSSTQQDLTPSYSSHRRQRKTKKTPIDDPDVVTFFQDLGLPPSFFEDGKCLAEKLHSTDPDFYRIHKYVENSQELALGVKILGIMKITPNVQRAPLDFKDDPEINGKHRKMLFHGTKVKNFKSILEKGLRLPQDDTAGIFFGDRVAKSCFYTDGGDELDRTGQQGYLLICDVLLGRMYTGHLRYGARAAPPTEIFNLFGIKLSLPCQSVFSRGIRIPDPKDSVTVDGCEWPLGVTICDWDHFYNFNEYMIYDAKQVQPKFIIQIEFTAGPYHPVLKQGRGQ